MTDRTTPGTMGRDAPQRPALGLALGALGVAVFGGTLPATRIALTAFSPDFVTFGRATVASAAAVLVLAVMRRSFPKPMLGSLLLAGMMLVFGFPILSTLALRTVPAAHGGVVLGVLPLATALFAALLTGERPSPAFWACSLAGGLLVVIFSLREGTGGFETGDLLLFAAAISASLGYVVSGRIARTMPGWEVICWALIVTAPGTLLGTWWSWDGAYLQAPPRAIAAFLYLGFGSMFLGFFAWNVGLAIGGIARVSQVQLLQTFVTLGLSALLLSEPITPATIGFAIGVVALVALGRRTRVSRRA